MLAIASPASAHPTSVWLSNGQGHGGVHTGHTWAYVCDDESDHQGVNLQYKLRSGRTGVISDTNGSSSGCGEGYVTTPRDPIDTYKVCWNGGTPECAISHQPALTEGVAASSATGSARLACSHEWRYSEAGSAVWEAQFYNCGFNPVKVRIVVRALEDTSCKYVARRSWVTWIIMVRWPSVQKPVGYAYC
jgi:hypothetical protein